MSSATKVSDIHNLSGAVIGYGFIGSKGHIPAYLSRPDVKIKAICDVSEERRQLAKKVLPNAEIYSDYNELLAKEKGRIDFVDIASPASTHAGIIHAALNSGVHVLCEKPLTTTLKDATSVLKHAQESKRVLFPCHNYKHAPVVQAIREIVESGRIGKINSITLNTFRNTHAVGVPEWKPDWRRSKEYSGGGIAMDHGSHSLYLTFDWLRSYPKSITAKMHNLNADKFDTEDNFNATLTFPTGIATLHLTWTAGVRKVIYTLQGDRGAITVDDDDMQIAYMKNASSDSANYAGASFEFERKSISSHWMDSSHISWFNSLFDSFKQAIQTNDFMNKEIMEAWLCIQAITTAYASAEQGSIELPLSTEPIVST